MTPTTTKPRGIIFEPWQVRAAIEERLEQVRIPIRPTPRFKPFQVQGDASGNWYNENPDYPRRGNMMSMTWKPPARIGDEIFVREDWCYGDGTGEFDDRGRYEETEKRSIHYRADWAGIDDDVKWNPANTMPPEASRLWFTVTAVRAERVREIAEADASKCGVQLEGCMPQCMTIQANALIKSYLQQWDVRHGEGATERDWCWLLSVSPAKPRREGRE